MSHEELNGSLMECSDDEGNGDTFLNPEDLIEVIDIDEKTDIDDVADRLMDVLDNAENENEENSEIDNNGDDDNRDDESLLEEEINEPGDRIAPLRFFTEHEGSVFSCSLSSCGKYAATGGEDDKAYLWSIETGEVLLQCSNHTDSVEFVEFSEDDKYLATADLKGNVQVWSVAKRELVWNGDTDSDINCLVWFKHVLFCGTNDSQIWMWLIPAGNFRTFVRDGSPVSTIAVTSDGQFVVGGFKSGAVGCFHIKSKSKLTLDERSNHSDEVTVIKVHSEGKLFATGGMDGAVKLNTMPDYNKKKSGKLVYIACPPTPDDSIECLGFSNSHPNLLVVGRLSGVVSVYDMVNQSQRHSLALPCEVSRVTISPVSPSAYFSCLDGNVRVVDILSGKQTHKLIGHSKGVLSVATDRSGQIILSSSDDGTGAIFAVEH